MSAIRFLVIPVALLAVAVLAPSASSGSVGHASTARDGVPSFTNAFVIVGENTSAEQITKTHAPYLAGTLKPKSAWLTGYRSYLKSSSLGQYIAMTSGQFTKCEGNNDLPDHCHQRVDNVFSQLDRSGHSWKEWSESMANQCDIVDHGAAFAKNIFSAHHTPAIYYTQIHGKAYDEAITPNQECLTHVLSTGSSNVPDDTSAFDASLAGPATGTPTLTYVVPNDCENGHDPCGTKDPVRQFDDFLAREVPKIEASPAFGPSSVIFITWDEGADPPLKPTHVLTVVTGPLVKPGTTSAAPYTHPSLLRTLEDGFGLPVISGARTVNAFSGIWR